MRAVANGALIGGGIAVMIIYGNFFLGIWLLGIGIAAFTQHITEHHP